MTATMRMTEQRSQLARVCVDLEKQIFEVYSNPVRCPICNDDWTDAHQEYLEYKEFKEELNNAYLEAQKELFAYLDSIGESHGEPRTAEEYYIKQKDFEDLVNFYTANHINGF